MEHTLQDITSLVSAYGLIVIFLGMMIEGTAMILISGILCYLGMLSFTEVLPVAILGAVIGDHIWFYLGGRYGTSLLEKFPKLAKQSKKALHLIAKKADLIAVTARFIYAGGIIFPLMLGLQMYPKRRYHIFDILGDTLWAFIGLSLGYYLGNGVEKVFGKIEQVEHLLLLLFVIMVLVWAYKNKTKQQGNKMVEFMKKAMDWVLEKEADAAKNCHATPEEIEKQIKSLEEKRENLRKKFDEEDAEFGHILSKLQFIKAESMKCHSGKS